MPYLSILTFAIWSPPVASLTALVAYHSRNPNPRGTKPTALDIEAGDTLVARVKGDGRDYLLNLYTKSRRMAFSYRADLPTTKDEWTEVAISLADFIPTSFGRRVKGMGPFEPDQINGVGFMLSDKKAGPFTMQVEWVKARRPDTND